MKHQTKTYKVKAIETEQFGVSRHGVRTRKGGHVAGVETFDYLFTPFYLADEIMRERFPNCDIVIERPAWLPQDDIVLL